MESLQNRNGEAVARSALAWACIYVGEIEQARANFRRALKTYQSMGNLRGQAVTIYGIGLTYKARSSLSRLWNTSIARWNCDER